ncbi:MAG: hypothetical protein JW732_04415 [Dehalococcoidia bacterium]|nr:hypothetical protein [Dehalococcoidia bacterium]
MGILLSQNAGNLEILIGVWDEIEKTDVLTSGGDALLWVSLYMGYRGISSLELVK